MRDPALEKLLGPARRQTVAFDALMPWRVRHILLVSSLYDSFVFEEEGRLTEVLFSEYLELNLRYAPFITRVSTAAEALREVRSEKYDLVISMTSVGDMDPSALGRAIHEIAGELPVVLLAHTPRELAALHVEETIPGIDRVFVWLGDHRLFLAIIKSVEDRMNAWHDASVADIRSIILVEDSVRFYSAYLPMLYTELVRQTQVLMADGVNRMQKLIRMRARPKILHATTYEEALELYDRYHGHVLGVISDGAFPRDGKVDPLAGIALARSIREDAPDLPILLQSSDDENAARASAFGAAFLNKRSPNLLQGLVDFMRTELGFGDFVFRHPDGRVVSRASDLGSLIEQLGQVPDETLVYHAMHNHFSTWLMARTEFDLAKAMRPRRIDEFTGIAELRAFLLAALDAHRERARAGVVSEFSRGTFDARSGFVRIGTGSLGGKGRGLAFFHALINDYELDHLLPEGRLFVPPTAVVATGVFDDFLRQSGLAQLASSDCDDETITAAFLAAELPEEVMSQLATFLSRVRYPLAVRSSSLLEDASYQPFAGIYRTYMIPNAHEDDRLRLEALCRAIKLVYASTFYADAKAYIGLTGVRLEEEKMAVVVQQIVGRRHENVIYPDLAGVARSHDFYPMPGQRPEEGVVSVALGLGRTVVDGGRCVRFSPAEPERLYQFTSPEETLKNAQRQFYALDLGALEQREARADDFEAAVVPLGLDVAERQGTLFAVGSVYSPENDAVYDGISRDGLKLVTMAGILKNNVFPLAAVTKRLLAIGAAAFSCPVEIEFAINLPAKRGAAADVGFLQIRPLAMVGGGQDIDLEAVPPEQAICVSNRALGHGVFDDIRDVVYVRFDRFQRAQTVEIAAEVGELNGRLEAEGRRFLLIGPGRWGSSDRWLGIPVSWRQISAVAAIVETDLLDMRVTPSQGTHFFQNMTSLGIGYFTVNFGADGGHLDVDWLDLQPAVHETPHVRVVRFADPLAVVIDARHGSGVVMKPGASPGRRSVFPMPFTNPTGG